MNEKVWRVVSVHVGRDAEELAASSLFELGALGIVTEEESADGVRLAAYFDVSARPEVIERSVEGSLSVGLCSSSLREISFSEIRDQDWMQKWKEGFEPTRAGERLIVAPSWKLPATSDGRVVIQIDPGMAFGTGTHETTRLCLEAIERHWRGGAMLDVGAGTGILAIAAALLVPGSRVVAIDVDPQAVEIARQNVVINGVAASVEVLDASPRKLRGGSFDLLAANLTGEVIVGLMDDLSACLAASGTMILSGILTELASDVVRCVSEAGLSVLERREAGEWSLLVAKRG